MIPGEGVIAKVTGKTVKAGNLKLMKGISTESSGAKKYLNRGSTVIYVAVDETLAGYIVLSDKIREESGRMLDELKSMCVETVLLTGDNKNVADTIAAGLDIGDVKSECLPEDKLRCIEEYQGYGSVVCMIGDGINDAPALKRSNVGIAMGGVGSDIALDAADIVLVDDEIKELPHLVALSRRMMSVIKLNLIFSMGLNFLSIALAVTGLLGPVVGALVHNAGSVLVIGNSTFLLGWKKKSGRND